MELKEGILMTRPTKCAALALMARASLYFASPLFSNNPDYPYYDQQKLGDTYRACDQIIKAPWCELAPAYSNSWNMDSPELIFGVSFNQGSDVYSGIHPTQSMVDKYCDISGFVYYPENPIVFGTAYQDMENRYVSTIAIPTTTDGYTLKKPMSTILPIFRFADILLCYAEASVKIGSVSQAEIDKSINLVRKRGKLPDLTSATMDDVERERLVELAFEGHRFWDVRRWKKGGSYFGSSINILQVSDEGGKLVGSRKNIALPYWNESYNFYPTPW